MVTGSRHSRRPRTAGSTRRIVVGSMDRSSEPATGLSKVTLICWSGPASAVGVTRTMRSGPDCACRVLTGVPRTAAVHNGAIRSDRARIDGMGGGTCIDDPTGAERTQGSLPEGGRGMSGGERRACLRIRAGAKHADCQNPRTMRLEPFLAAHDEPRATYLWARWLLLRALGLIFFSAFYALAFQIHGLIGDHGILPAADYLTNVRQVLGSVKGVWFAPTLLWLGASDLGQTLVVAAGIVGSLLLTANVWPRLTAGLCT